MDVELQKTLSDVVKALRDGAGPLADRLLAEYSLRLWVQLWTNFSLFVILGLTGAWSVKRGWKIAVDDVEDRRTKAIHGHFDDEIQLNHLILLGLCLSLFALFNAICGMYALDNAVSPLYSLIKDLK